MLIKTGATFHYLCETTRENGTPTIKKIEKKAICSLRDSFSTNYYGSVNRTMDMSLNLVVQKHHTLDIKENEEIYKLRQLMFNDKLYKIVNILQDFNEPRRKILDCELMK